MSKYFVAIHEGDEATGRRVAEHLVQACRLGRANWGWNSETYPRVVKAIQDAEALQIAGFVGSSFASVRADYLGDAGIDLWTLIARPFSTEQTGLEWLRRRQARLSQQFVPIRFTLGTPHVPGRSVPVTSFDVRSAEIYQAYSGEKVPASAKDVGKASDALWGRYMIDDITVGWLAYWDEVCRVMTWRDLGSSPGDGSLQVLASMHLPCLFIEGVDAPQHHQFTCIITSTADAVVPATPGYDPTWAKVQLSTPVVAHRSLDRMSDCWHIIEERTGG